MGALGDAKGNCEWYGSGDRGASADFFVGHGGDVWQANDFYNFYSWHCGGGYQSTWTKDGGGRLYGICTNRNSIGIEMCVKKKSTATMNATDTDWFFTAETEAATAELVKYLMKELDIDIDHVVRHYDVNRKICPNPYVIDTGKWQSFKEKLKTETKTSKAGTKDLIRIAEDIGKTVSLELKNGKKWEYINGKPPASTFADAIRQGKRYVSCANGVIWACKQSGVCSADGWFGEKGGGLNYGGNKTALEAAFTITDGSGKTLKQLLDSGKIQAGDIVTYCEFNHTNLYLGDNRWYDTGHANCSGKGEGAPFLRFVGTGTPYLYNKVGKILRCKDAGQAQTEEKWYRVRTSWTDEKSQTGAYKELENAKKNCPSGYAVYDSKGKEVYRNTAKGTQAKSLNGLSEAEKIKRVAPLYQDVAKKTGMLASVGLAQFCLESGFGTTDLAQNANNLHGMKCSLSGNTWKGSVWDGVSKYNKRTAEQDASGHEYYIYADFRKYRNIEESIADRAAYYLGATNGNERRYPGIENCRTAEEQIRAIKAGGYATDVNYVSKLLNLVSRFNLIQYDSKTKSEPEPEKKENPEKKKETEKNILYRVQVGAFDKKENAAKLETELKQKNLIAFTEKGIDKIYRTYCGSFGQRQNAEERIRQLKDLGYKNSFIKEIFY